MKADDMLWIQPYAPTDLCKGVAFALAERRGMNIMIVDLFPDTDVSHISILQINA